LFTLFLFNRWAKDAKNAFRIAHSNLDMRFLLQDRARESLVSFFKRAPDRLNLSGNRGVQVVDHETQVVDHETVKLSVLPDSTGLQVGGF